MITYGILNIINLDDIFACLIAIISTNHNNLKSDPNINNNKLDKFRGAIEQLKTKQAPAKAYGVLARYRCKKVKLIVFLGFWGFGIHVRFRERT